MTIALEIFTDGACSGNPGESGIGVVINQDGKTIQSISEPIGEATNNIAEYSALVYALQEALLMKADSVQVFSDSELMCKQVRGEYKIKNVPLQFLCKQARRLISGLGHFEIHHIPREKNKQADKLATDAVKKQTKVVASLFDHSGEESPSSIG